MSTRASEWCGKSILGGLSIKSALLWWNTGIMMCNKMGWIAKHVRNGCHRVKVVLPCVQSLIYWKAIEGMATLISRINPWILSIQSLDAHQRGWSCSDVRPWGCLRKGSWRRRMWIENTGGQETLRMRAGQRPGCQWQTTMMTEPFGALRDDSRMHQMHQELLFYHDSPAHHCLLN